MERRTPGSALPSARRPEAPYGHCILPRSSRLRFCRSTSCCSATVLIWTRCREVPADLCRRGRWRTDGVCARRHSRAGRWRSIDVGRPPTPPTTAATSTRQRSLQPCRGCIRSPDDLQAELRRLPVLVWAFDVGLRSSVRTASRACQPWIGRRGSGRAIRFHFSRGHEEPFGELLPFRKEAF
jgi:hypothetical protein